MVGKKNIQLEIQQILNGDDKLTYKYYQQLKKYLHKRNIHGKLTEETMEDIIQFSWFNFLRNAQNGKFKYESNIGTYLCGIGRNQYFKVVSEQDKLNDSIEINWHNVIDEDRTKEDERLATLSVVLEEELKKLTEDCQQLMKEVMHGSSQKEILEETIYESLAYLKTKISRCRGQLRKLFEKNDTYKILLQDA